MIEKDTLIKVRNRDNGTVGYTIPDLGNLHRTFQPNEIKKLSFEELQKLSWVDGGAILLRDYLVIEDNPEAIAELIGKVEPEYNYTEKEVTVLLQSGSLDQLKDALDYAPKGVIELIKDLAVKLPLNDIAKMKAIKEKTGFNVETAIMINEETSEKIDEKTNGGRRAEPISVNGNQTQTIRRSEPITTGKYNIVSVKQ